MDLMGDWITLHRVVVAAQGIGTYLRDNLAHVTVVTLGMANVLAIWSPARCGWMARLAWGALVVEGLWACGWCAWHGEGRAFLTGATIVAVGGWGYRMATLLTERARAQQEEGEAFIVPFHRGLQVVGGRDSLAAEDGNDR